MKVKKIVFAGLMACALASAGGMAACAPTAADAPDAAGAGVSSDDSSCAFREASYSVDAEGMVTVDGEAKTVREMCLTCHNDGDAATGMDWDDIVAFTADWKGNEGVNPHESHMGPMQCDSCHVNASTEIYCNTCHNL